jgi:hypothetical protein
MFEPGLDSVPEEKTMQLAVNAKSGAARLWVVSNGSVEIGPVRTELLVRGVRHGRVPPDCQVREAGSTDWRPVEQVREVAGILGQPGSVADFQRAAAGFRTAREEREVLLMLLHGAVNATRATRGLIHRLRPPIDFLVTSYAHGGVDNALGQVVHAHDPAYTIARSGQRLSGSPRDGLAERLVAERLGDSELAGIVMVPVTFGMELLAMLELGRDDRPFRANDVDELSRLATLAIARLDELLG